MPNIKIKFYKQSIVRSALVAILLMISSLALSQQDYFQHIEELRKMAETAKDELADTLYMEVGRAFAYTMPADAIVYLQKSLELAEKHNRYRIMCMANSFTGIAYSQMGSYAQSVEYFKKQLNIAKRLGILDEVAWANSNLGQVLLEIKNYELAKEYLQEANDLADLIGDDYMKQYVYSNMGWLKLCLAEYQESLTFYEKALAIRKKHPTDSINLAANYRDIGNLYFAQSDFENAKLYYSLSSNYCNTLFSSLLAPVMVKLSYIHLESGNLDSALSCISQALDMANRGGEKSVIRDAYGIYGSIYYKMGKFDKAEQCYSMQIAYHDSVNLSDVSKKIYELQFHEKLESQKLARETAEYHTRTFVHLVIAIAVLLIASVFIIFWLRKKRMTINSMNQELVYNNLQTNESIAYAQRIQKAVMPDLDCLDKFFADKFLFFRPKHAVSGNFYWTFSNDVYGMLAVCDSGEAGIPGGCISMLGLSVLHELAEIDADPAIVLELYRRKIVSALKSVSHVDGDSYNGSDISLMVMDRHEPRLYFSGVKHPLLIVRQGKLLQYQENKESDSFITKDLETCQVDLQDGDMIYLMTHGMARQNNADGQELSRERLFQHISSISNLPMEKQHQELLKLLDGWMGKHPQQRDVLIIGVLYKREITR